MGAATAVLIVLFNASNWSDSGKDFRYYPSMADCSKALAELKIAQAPNSGITVVAFCVPK